MVFAGARGAAARYGPVDADIDSANVIYTVPLSALGLVPGQTFSFRVLAFDRYFTGHLEDSVNDMKYTVGSPRYGFAGGNTFTRAGPRHERRRRRWPAMPAPGRARPPGSCCSTGSTAAASRRS